MKRALALIFAEGFLDRVAAEKLVWSLGLRVDGSSTDAGGIDRFWKSIRKYNEAAKRCGPVLALADHDGVDCVGPKLSTKLKSRHPNLILRLSVAELEAWLLADAARLAAHLSVSPARFPAEPDKERDPKQTLINLARSSTKPAIRAAMVPKPGYTNTRGPEFTLVMEQFIRERWRPLEAEARSPSLRRAIAAIRKATGNSSTTRTPP